jgi:hypothetical protein
MEDDRSDETSWVKAQNEVTWLFKPNSLEMR